MLKKKLLLLRWKMILGGVFCIFIVGFYYNSSFRVNASNIELNEESIQQNYGNVLYELNLFKGTEKGFELDQRATRAQGAVMLVRYLGLEEFAIEAYDNGEISHPFNDVPSWANAHVAYLYQQKLTNGMSSTTYGSNVDMTANQYATMILRLLGYDDKNSDFIWTNAIEFYLSTYSLEESFSARVTSYASLGMTRGIMVEISYITLYLDYKYVEQRVIDKLYYSEVLSPEQYVKYKVDVFSQDPKTVSEMKGIWVSYLDLKPILQNKKEIQFRSSIDLMFDQIADSGFNTVFVQVRPFSDALYKSEVYDWSYLLSGVEGVFVGYDPLTIMVEEARKSNLKIEAWINPYRIRTDINKEPLSAQGKIQQLIDENENITFHINNTLMFNPAKEVVQQLIVDGVREIVEGYDVDGIHFDDYFYQNAGFDLDQEDYDSYKQLGGLLSQKEFRKNNIDQLVAKVYQTIKATKPDVVFGISPQGSMVNNDEHSYINVEKWIQNTGYIDYILPQIYYGFENETLPFEKVINEWNKLLEESHVKLYIGLAAYKIGLLDAWAGTGRNEWQNETSVLKNMIEASRKLNNYNGVALFRYDSLYNANKEVANQVIQELNGIKQLFQN